MMKNRMHINFDLVENKNKLFVYVTPKPGIKLTIDEILVKVYEKGYRIKKLFSGNIELNKEFLLIYDLVSFAEEFKAVDLTTSYGASSLEVAPSSITDPKPKPARRKRTRKTTTKN